MSTAPSSRVGRLLDILLGGVLVVGVSMAIIWAVCAAWRSTIEPFPTFGPGLARHERGIALVIVVLWCLWAVSAWQRAVRARLQSIGMLYVISLLATILGGFCWVFALPVINALFDFSRAVPTPIYVVGTGSTEYRSTRWGRSQHPYARVHRMGHPDERVVINWAGCHLPRNVVPSPFARLSLARGALGVPWFSLPIDCHPLRVSDRPLLDGVSLGRDVPVVLIALHTYDAGPDAIEAHFGGARERLIDALARIAEARSTDSREDAVHARLDATALLTEPEQSHLEAMLHDLPVSSPKRMAAIGRPALAYVQDVLLRRDSGQLFRRWSAALRERSATTPIVLVWQGGLSGPRFPVDCARCIAIAKKDTDDEILGELLGGEDPWDAGDRVYLADAAGRRSFSAALRDVGQIPNLLAALAAPAAPPAPPPPPVPAP